VRATTCRGIRSSTSSGIHAFADMHDGVWDARRGRYLVAKRTAGRVHVHHDEPGAACGRPAGVGIAERDAKPRWYARERKQGHAIGTRDGSNDHRASGRQTHAALHARLTRAARVICFATAGAIVNPRTRTRGRRKAGTSAPRCSRDCKAFSRISASKSFARGAGAGGMGSSRRPAPRSITDARIAAIYEGTNGIRRPIGDAQAASRTGRRGDISELRGK